MACVGISPARPLRQIKFWLFLWLSLPAPLKASVLTQTLLERDVAVRAASEFAVDDGPVPEAIRVCLGGVREIERLKSALQTIARTLTEGARSKLG